MTKFKQTDSTHILDHIHKWRHHRRLVKTYVPDQLLEEWFVKYLLAPILEDVPKFGFMTKKKVIAYAHYLDLVYTQLSTLYDSIPNALIPSNIVHPPPGKEYHVVDGIIGFVSQWYKGKK